MKTKIPYVIATSIAAVILGLLVKFGIIAPPVGTTDTTPVVPPVSIEQAVAQ